MHSDVVHPDEEDSEANHATGAPLEQSDKPRAGSKHPPVSFNLQVAKPTCDRLVAAEYLAKGYKLSDNILQRAIHLDCEF